MADFLVPASGIMALIGALSILVGYRAKIGAALIVLFLVPVTFSMHAFWTMSDPMMVQMQAAMFFKNLALIGGALMIGVLGTGPLSLDARVRTVTVPSSSSSDENVRAYSAR